jgi:hypothetical protein
VAVELADDPQSRRPEVSVNLQLFGVPNYVKAPHSAARCPWGLLVKGVLGEIDKSRS